MKDVRLPMSLLLLFFLTGCTTLPPMDFLVSDLPEVKRKDIELVSVTVGYVPKTKGVVIETNHLVPTAWQTSLQDAINRSLIFSDDTERKVTISVRIDHFDLPAFGVAMKTSCGATYEILDRSSGEIVFSERIMAEGVTPADYAFAGVVRAQESVNRCARNNISLFLSNLGSSNI